jgi:hypothetical protein
MMGPAAIPVHASSRLPNGCCVVVAGAAARSAGGAGKPLGDRQGRVRTRPHRHLHSQTGYVLRARPRNPLAAPRPARPAPVPGGLGSALGFGAGAVVTLAAAGLGAHAAPAFGLALLTATAVATAATTTLPGALGAAVQCWALWDGFLVDDLGQLTLTRQSTPALACLAVAAGLTSLVATTARNHSARRSTPGA